MRTLTEGAIYSLSLTPCQYVARRYTGAAPLVWVLVPVRVSQGDPSNDGPPAYVLEDGRIGVHQGITEYTTDDLDFTGRFAP